MTGRVAGKAALITGAAGGLGQAMARMLVQRLVLTAQACLLHRDAPPAVAQAFITTRLGHSGAGRVLGALDTRQMDWRHLLQRALPG